MISFNNFSFKIFHIVGLTKFCQYKLLKNESLKSKLQKLIKKNLFSNGPFSRVS